ncbi:MAG: hypothetical protein ACI91J_003394, partial [Yoonia sp.]
MKRLLVANLIVSNWPSRPQRRCQVSSVESELRLSRRDL